jgi:hypothetical protein
METPESMRSDLGAWNNGAGIDLDSWINCEGRFALAVGYTTVFWPPFELREGYILRAGVPDAVLRGFEDQEGSTRLSVEATLNHLHLADIHYLGCPDISVDKLMVLGTTLKEIYEAKLRSQFPDRPCVVRFFIPDDSNDFEKYEVSFWQLAHEVAH